jgi:hypothetical protein
LNRGGVQLSQRQSLAKNGTAFFKDRTARFIPTDMLADLKNGICFAAPEFFAAVLRQTRVAYHNWKVR